MFRATGRNGGRFFASRLAALLMALLALLIAGAPDAAAADKITLRFEVFGLMGLRVLSLRTQLEQQGDRYVVTAEYATAGIAGMVTNQATHAVARGRLTPGSAEPELFQNNTRHGRTDYQSRVEYRPDGNIVGGVTPAPENPVPPEAMRGTVDNLTAYLRLERQLGVKKSCALSVPVFDGAHRYDLVFTGGKKETLEPEGGQEYAGETITCNMTRYNRHVDESVQNAGARQGTFWYAALLPGGDILVPVRMRLRTQIGSVDVYLAEAQGRGVDIQLMK
jgi:hypothetical protein